MGPDPRGGGGGAQGEARVWLAAGRCENSIIGSGVGREEASELSGTAGVGGRTGASPEGAPQGRGELAECVSGPIMMLSKAQWCPTFCDPVEYTVHGIL